MPRRARVRSKTGNYHILVEGLKDKKLFYDNEDRDKFLSILEEKKLVFQYKLFGYLLAENHFHLVINENKSQIGNIMKGINVSYAYYLNRKYDLNGHVFNDRFKSEPLDEIDTLCSAITYLHKKPVRDSMVSNMSDYNWSSFNEYFSSEPYILDTDLKERVLDHKNKEMNFLDVSEKEEKKFRKKHDIRDFIYKQLLARELSISSLKKDSNKDNLAEIINLLREMTNLSINEICEELDVERNVVMKIVYKK